MDVLTGALCDFRVSGAITCHPGIYAANGREMKTLVPITVAKSSGKNISDNSGESIVNLLKILQRENININIDDNIRECH